MDFTKLKQLLTGIPADPAAQEQIKKANEQVVNNEIGAIDAKRTGREMTLGEKEAEAKKQQMVADIGENVSGMAGRMGVVKEIADPQLLYKIGEKVSNGQRLNAAESYFWQKNMGKGGTTVVEPMANPFEKLKAQLGKK